MKTRVDYGKAAPGSVQAMYKLEKYVQESGLERPLLELIKTRVSQLNGCAFCIDLHTKDARAAGETEQRLYGLSAWREAPFYSERERAALAWAEVIGERAQRLTGYACIAFGIVLLMVGLNAMVSFIRPGGLLGGMLS